MKTKIITTRRADNDVDSILEYLIEQKALSAAARFSGAYEKTLEFLANFPEAGSPWPDGALTGLKVRFKQIKRFENYLIIYRITPDGIVVSRVLHARQNLDLHLRPEHFR